MPEELEVWAAVAAALFAGIAVLFTGLEMRRGRRDRRLSQISSVLRELYRSKNLRDMYYRLEYGKFEYGPDFHGSSQEEPLDELLKLFEALARGHRMGSLLLQDLQLIAYEYLVIYQDRHVQEYLRFLDGWYEARGIRRRPFESFRETGRLLEKKEYRSPRASD